METRKVVINTCFGGFNLSDKAIGLYAGLTNQVFDNIVVWDIKRDDPMLVRVVETLGGEMGFATRLRVVEIPADVEWEISEYDGWEHVAEKHRRWS